ncbi:MAG TPA: YfhO family protein [Acidimicrobiales bacterium]|nr:YfhO family protein [Acidimicrobiales bacterium]
MENPSADTVDGSPPAAVSKGRRMVAVAMLLAVGLSFTFPALAGRVRFPVDFAGPAPGEAAGPLANPELGDAYFALYPWHSYLGERLGQGDVPLWDPYRLGGTPFAADTATGTWYPPNWLYASGHILSSFTLIAVVSIFGALFLAYWFFRVIELDPLAAALGAVAFALSAYMIKWSSNDAVFGSAMWLPLALGGIEVARRGPVRRGVLLAGTGLALSVLAGHAQVALYVWLAALGWASLAVVGGLRDPRDRVRWFVRRAAAVAAAFALAVGLAAIQLVPTAELSGHIVRQTTTFDVAKSTALPPEHLPTLLLPDYRGSPLDGNFVGPGINYTATAWYAGLLTLPLAVLGLLARPRRPAAFFALLTAFGVLASFGTVIYRAVLLAPGFDRTLFVTHFILFVNFGLAGLAALGLHSLLAGQVRRARLVAPALVAALAGVVLILTLDPIGTPLPVSYVRQGGVRALVLVVVGGLLLTAMVRLRSRSRPLAAGVVAVLAVDLWLFGFPFNPYHEPRPVYPRTQEIDLIADAAGQRPRFADLEPWWVLPNGALTHELHGIGGYDPFVMRRLVELVAIAEDQTDRARGNLFGPFDPETFASPVMDLLGVRTVTGPPDGLPGSSPSHVGRFALFDRPSAFPPAFLTSCWEEHTGVDALDRLETMSAAELRSTVVLDRAPTGGPDAPTNAPTGSSSGGGGPACGPAGDATLSRYEPERVVVEARADVASILVLTDNWFPGWEARVDGRKVEVLRADHSLRGVALSPGAHRVEFDYRPRTFRAGATISLATAAVAFASVLVPMVMRRRGRARVGRTGT